MDYEPGYYIVADPKERDHLIMEFDGKYWYFCGHEIPYTIDEFKNYFTVVEKVILPSYISADE